VPDAHVTYVHVRVCVCLQEVEHDILQRVRFELELVRNIAAQVGSGL